MILLNTKIDVRSIVIFVAIVIVGVIFMYVKEYFDKKKGFDSQEKHALKDIFQKLMPDGTAVYASWYETTRNGNTKITKYWYYGIGFNDNELCVVPLSIDKGELSYSKHFTITKEDLGMITCNLNKKDNMYSATLYDKERKEILQIAVKDSNTKEDKFHPVNIQQQEETNAFGAWLEAWQEEVNRVNDAPVRYKKVLNADCYEKVNKK